MDSDLRKWVPWTHIEVPQGFKTLDECTFDGNRSTKLTRYTE